MSDPEPTIERWELPSFERPGAAQAPVDLAQEEALARARGFEQGRSEGREAGLVEARELVARMAALADEIARPYRGLDGLVTLELARLAMTIARQVVRRELTLDSSAVGEVVGEAMTALSTIEGDIEIFLNPADLATIRELTPEVLEGRSWRVTEDTEMLPGGCRIKTPLSYVDASAEKQLEMILLGLMEAGEAALED